MAPAGNTKEDDPNRDRPFLSCTQRGCLIESSFSERASMISEQMEVA